MTMLAFLVAVAKAILIVAPAVFLARRIRLRFSAVRVSPLAGLIEVVLSLCWLLVVSELLGLVGGLRFGWLMLVLWLAAALAFVHLRGVTTDAERPPPRVSRTVADRPFSAVLAAGVGIWLVLGEWVFSTANALGSGMGSFDVLWYHMPFAAVFAHTGSLTGIHFTQADPFVAYYPANSELFHALGIIAFGNDFLSPILNLGWLALGLLGAWCVGRRWRLEWWTLAGGALLFSLPVLSTTQPGEAFNDVVGLAALAVAVALILAPECGSLEWLTAGLALGLAAGTKYTFLVPAIALVVGVAAVSPRGERKRTGLLLVGGLVITSAWWYVRALVHTGNPLGLRQTLGPLHLAGASSPMAAAQQQSVFSQLQHTSLWSSRFAPGLAHAFGPLWPVVLLAVAGAIVVALTRPEPVLRVVAFAAFAAGISYLFLPTGATAIQQSSMLFEVNLRYTTPSVALGLLLLPVAFAPRSGRVPRLLAVGMIAVAVLAQLERSVWPTQTARHIAFLLVIGAGLTLAMPLLAGARQRSRRVIFAGLAVGIVALGVGYVVQRHYFRQRYLVGRYNSTAIGAIYHWAQTISHKRIALYGTLEQYPLYGAKDTNSVDYLGQPAPHGGYQPVMDCSRWQTLLQTGGYDYLVLGRAPTAAIPLSWTTQDPNLTAMLHPSATDWVFRVDAGHLPAHCAGA